APLTAYGKRHGTVAQRAHINLFRIESPEKGNGDVPVAFKSFRNPNVLNTRRGVGLEPTEIVNLVPFDRHQPGAGVRSADFKFDLFARSVFRLVQTNLQLGVLLKIA